MTRAGSEILRELIGIVWGDEEAEVTLQEAMELYGEMVLRERGGRGPRVVCVDEMTTWDETKAGEMGKRIKTGSCKEPATQADPPKEREKNGGEPGVTVTFVGKGAGEKAAIHKRLKEYREKHGLGCFIPLAKLTNRVLTDDDIRGMLIGEGAPLARWKVLEAALDKAEKEGVKT